MPFFRRRSSSEDADGRPVEGPIAELSPPGEAEIDAALRPLLERRIDIREIASDVSNAQLTARTEEFNEALSKLDDVLDECHDLAFGLPSHCIEEMQKLMEHYGLFLETSRRPTSTPPIPPKQDRDPYETSRAIARREGVEDLVFSDEYGPPK